MKIELYTGIFIAILILIFFIRFAAKASQTGSDNWDFVYKEPKPSTSGSCNRLIDPEELEEFNRVFLESRKAERIPIFTEDQVEYDKEKCQSCGQPLEDGVCNYCGAPQEAR